jgi:DNA topoisomerase-1
MKDYIIRKVINKNNKKYEYYKVIDNKINSKIKNKITLEKISKIYIPPAYDDVKIFLNQELLATGIDSAGRKQYIYSENRKKKRELKKYNQIYKLSKNIHKLKRKIKSDLCKKDFDKNKLIALTLKIMDLCNFRSGNKKYEEKYGSYGLTTLHKKHVKINKNKITIEFIGKKGVNNNCVIKNKSLQNIIEKVYKLSSKDNNYLLSIKICCVCEHHKVE